MADQGVVPRDQLEAEISEVGTPAAATAAPAAAAAAAPAAAAVKKAPVDLTLSNFTKPESRDQLVLECVAAVTVSLAMVPEAVAFALTAQVSPMVGMQAAWIICIITAIFGGRPGVVSGATGAVAVVLPPVVEKYGAEGLFLCVMLAGVFQMLLGLIGFGHFLIKMMPHPVMCGFCNGLAILIGFAQFNLMKVPAGWSDASRRLGGDTFGAFTKHDQSVTPWIVGSEALCFAVHILLTMGICLSFPMFKRTKPLPAALTAIVLCTLLEHFVIRQIDAGAGTKLVRDHAGGSLSGQFPTPVWTDSRYSMPCKIPLVPGVAAAVCTKSMGAVLADVAVVSMQMALIGLTESLLTDNLIADYLDAPMDSRRTCFAQGLANLICGAFGGMGGCATIGQSILNVKRIGSRSRFSTVIMGIILLMIILLLSSAVEQIPVASLVGVMFMIVYDTFEWKSPALMIGSFLPRSVREWAAGADAGTSGCWQNFVKNHFGTKVPHSDAFTILLVSIVSILPESNLAYAVTAGILFKAITHAWGSAGFLVGSERIENDAEGKPVKRIVVLHGDVFFASMEQLEKLFTNKQIASDPVDVEVHCEHSHLTDFSAMHVINIIGAKYKAQGKTLTITRLIPICSRVVNEAISGNQPMLTDVTVKNVVGESAEESRQVEQDDLAMVQVAKKTAEGDDDEDREF